MPGFARPHPESLTVGAILTVLVALGQISTSIYIPSMPSLVAVFETTPERVNLTLSVYLAGFAVSQLIYGPLSDRYGRRVVLLSGLALYFLASLACVMAGSIEALVAGRFVQALGACAGPVLGRAIVRDVYGRERAAKAMAYIGVAFAVSPGVTPIIGGYLQVWFGWQASFWFLTGVAVAITGAVGLLLEETSPGGGRAVRPRELVRTYRTLVADRVYVGYALAVGFVFAGLMTYTALGPFVFIELLGLAPNQYGLLAGINVIGFLGGSLAAGRLTTRLGTARMVFVGTLLGFAGGASMVVLGLLGYFDIYVILGPMILFLAGMGITFPNAMAGAMAPYPRAAGAASALVGFFQMAFAGVVAGAAGLLPLSSQMPMALVITGTAGAAFVGFVALAWRREVSGADRGAP
jgi:DHA1 family bicyclomycin/chloramphenicol resistance-like MFS transporter